MKHKAKLITALLLCAALLLAAAGCGGSNGENTEPEITGVMDQTVVAGSEFNALEGVTASDAEDGDITGKIVITAMPELSFQNGKAVPDKAGSYELVYSVEDKGGLTAEAYATLTVTRQTGEAEVYVDFDFDAPQNADSHGWEVKVADGVKASGELKQGAFVIDITDAGSGDGDIQLVKPGMALKAADYKVKIWAKSTKETYAHILARDESVEDWATFGGAYNVVIGEQIAPLELNFTSPGEGSAELIMNLGKITPNAANPADTTPSDFSVTIDKIEIYEISGEEHQVPVYNGNLSAADSVAISAGDGASATAGAGVFTIDSYPTDGGVWSIKADIGLGGTAIESGVKYYYSFTVKADNAQAGELLVESASKNDAARADFYSLNLAAGEETTITHSFTAGSSVDDPVIRMQIGNPSDGVSSNTITVTSVEFGTLEGNLDTVKTIDSFSAPRDADDYGWDTYNGTDEDNELGVGTVWTENGSLFYRIDQGGTTDWHNKLYMPVTLPADSYFTVEITARASKPVSCGFFLNPAGGWDPRVSEGIDFTTEEQTFTFDTTDTLILDMDFELLFQFGSNDLAAMGDVTIEFSNITIWQRSVS